MLLSKNNAHGTKQNCCITPEQLSNSASGTGFFQTAQFYQAVICVLLSAAHTQLLLPHKAAAGSKHIHSSVCKFLFLWVSLLAFLTLSELNEVLSQIQTRTNVFCSFLQHFWLFVFLLSQARYEPIIEMYLPLLVTDFSHKPQTFSYKINWVLLPVSLVSDLIPNSLLIIFLNKKILLCFLSSFFLRHLCSQDPILKTALWRCIAGILCYESL